MNGAADGGAGARTVLVITRAGMLTTVQDLGRPGLAAFGVSPSGAMDVVAHQLANVLCGDHPGAAALEITGPGAEFRFVAAHRFAIAGADLAASLDGVPLPVPFVGMAAAGARLAFPTRQAGARVSLALAGGLAAPAVFGSASTDVAGGLGSGVLRAGAELAVLSAPGSSSPASSSTILSPQLIALVQLFMHAARFGDHPGRLRFVPDPAGGVPAAAHAQLARSVFRVSTRSNRTGFRFEGDPLPTVPDPDRLSEPTAPGAIQLPPDGLPILLMADRNTTGGYPRLGHLISADRTRAAQLWPGDPVEFVPVEQSAAQIATRSAARAVAQALEAIARAVASRSHRLQSR
jgi:biotin-dependent carboxylase-like uncharacterized protein